MITAPALLASLVGLAPAGGELSAKGEVSVGAAVLGYRSFFRPSEPSVALEAAYHRALDTAGPGAALRVGGGVRASPPTANFPAPVELFARAQLAARLGRWESAAGLEVGVSGFARLRPPIVAPPATDLFRQEQARLGPVYLAFIAAPLALRFERFTVSALEVSFGTTPVEPGTAFRLQLLLARVGVSL